jgi:ferredoxin, 2Fe-2S
VLVRIEPSGLHLDVPDGESVAEAAWRLGYHWPTTCWGQADCMLCRVEVLEGSDAVRAAGPEEVAAVRQKLSPSLRRPATRLACRLEVTGEGVVLRKEGVRPPGVDQREGERGAQDPG